MLLSIAIFYLASTSPVLITLFYSLFISTVGPGVTIERPYVLKLLTQVAHTLKDLGHVCNFYIYCLSSKVFRNTFVDLFLSCAATCWK